jgi:tetratricopeptide (TPR) repeat protein
LSKKDKIGLMSNSGHLTDEAVALCVEAMMSAKGENKLPGNIKTHLMECSICNDRVIDLYSDIKDEPDIIQRIKVQTGSTKKNILFSKHWLKYAAAVLLVLIALGSYFIFHWSPTGDLFQKYFEPYPNILAMKGDVKTELSTALLYYEVRDWDSAILLFQKVLTNDQNNYSAMFYLGNALLANGKSDQAIYWLDKAYASDLNLSNQIKWYLALAHLAEGDRSNALNHLNSLIESDNFYRSKAKKLLKQIR